MSLRTVDLSFWKKQRVFLTGHTGFKGSWLTFWLHAMGAKVTGFSDEIPHHPSFFELLNISKTCNDIRGDINDAKSLARAIKEANPTIVFHLAAQPLVRRSYLEPIQTFKTNIIGTANLLESCREAASLTSVVIITTDKCYENQGTKLSGFVETDPLGGQDPYSASKACAEIVTAAYRSSFYSRGTTVSTARAGNVIGGGDWSEDRLLPDAMRSIESGTSLQLRNPDHVRPWQHVLDPLRGYLFLAESASQSDNAFGEPYNFAPDEASQVSVGKFIEQLSLTWKSDKKFNFQLAPLNDGKKESTLLKLSNAKAKRDLQWEPKIPFKKSLELSCVWYASAIRKESQERLRELTLLQIREWGGPLV